MNFDRSSLQDTSMNIEIIENVLCFEVNHRLNNGGGGGDLGAVHVEHTFRL